MIAKMNGYQAVYDALEQETGVRFGETDKAGMFGLFETPCIRLERSGTGDDDRQRGVHATDA